MSRRVVRREARAAAYYAALRDEEMIVAHVEECPEHPRINPLGVGFRQVPHATAFGKLMLAMLPGLLDGVRLPGVTSSTVTERSVLDRQLRQVTGTGLALEVDEFQAGLSCMAAPGTPRRVQAEHLPLGGGGQFAVLARMSSGIGKPANSLISHWGCQPA
ncbi:IclR family transcriptional regulator C-terminal domain-containing protein [Actinoplanes sp. NPDC048796]|uniref:IclR family transcriptional regulator domain-containing protein n=1 Tax=Actinoplanes sp. NPDC048796 TaxID=3155640 RepID=UPI0033DDAF3F